MSKRIFFFIRAYNDFDTQLPLMYKFSEAGYSVCSIIYFMNNNLFDPRTHEAFKYLTKNPNISFYTLADFSLGSKIVQSILRMLPRWFPKRAMKYIQNILVFRAKSNQGLCLKLLKAWPPDLIILDENLSDKLASPPFLDYVKKSAHISNIPIYMIQTGFDIFKDYHLNQKDIEDKIEYSSARCFYIPAHNSYEKHKALYKDENIKVMGNLRMDQSWISKMNDEITQPPYYNKHMRLNKVSNGKLKICIMLTKFRYGIDKDALMQTIEALDRLENVVIAIKPHTRGMVADFIKEKNLKNTIIVDDICSTALIRWSNFLLFMGSTIAFQSIVLGKPVGFLKYCQALDTIFDEGSPCIVYSNLFALLDDIKTASLENYMPQSPLSEGAIKAWMLENVYNQNSPSEISDIYFQDIVNDFKNIKQKTA